MVTQRLKALSWNGPLFALSFVSFWVAWTLPSLQVSLLFQKQTHVQIMHVDHEMEFHVQLYRFSVCDMPVPVRRVPHDGGPAPFRAAGRPGRLCRRADSTQLTLFILQCHRLTVSFPVLHDLGQREPLHIPGEERFREIFLFCAERGFFVCVRAALFALPLIWLWRSLQMRRRDLATIRATVVGKPPPLEERTFLKSKTKERIRGSRRRSMGVGQISVWNVRICCRCFALF